MSSNIPPIIHYCWFGGNPLPELAVKCIESWKKYFPEYEIKEWNENNFDLNCCDYVREAYEAKKWAFVSDYARFWILYNYGGLYFDTDVEVIKPMDNIIEKGSFMGCEPYLRHPNEEAYVEGNSVVNSGLGLGLSKGLSIAKEILENYEYDHFILPEKGGPKTVVQRVTEILVKHGFVPADQIQSVADVYIYPIDYFCPMNYNTGELTITNNTYTIHHYIASWLNEREKRIADIRRRYARQGRSGCKMERLETLPLRVANKIERLGFGGTVKFAAKKILRKV
mgnify:CR=1 FL=1